MSKPWCTLDSGNFMERGDVNQRKEERISKDIPTDWLRNYKMVWVKSDLRSNPFDSDNDSQYNHVTHSNNTIYMTCWQSKNNMALMI